MSPGILDRPFEAGLQPSQWKRITEPHPPFNQPANKLACRLNFVLEFSAFRLEVGTNGSNVIRGRSEFLDDEPSQFERPLQRTNVGSRQMAISGNVALRKRIELLAHLYDSRHRQRSRHRH